MLAASLSLSLASTGLDIGSPSRKLVHAARAGDFVAVRRVFLDHKCAELDLDSALDAAASHSQLEIVKFLVTFGAKDLESALLSSVARDNVAIASYLISKERIEPARNTQAAQTLAANIGSLNCDWLLTAHRWEQLRSS